MTLCKFQVYILQDQQTHWVQCTLPINIYIEKMYLIIFAWLCFLFVLIIISIVYNFVFIVRGKRFLSSEINDEKLDDYAVTKLKSYLRPDGMLCLKLLKSNTNRYYVSNVLTSLYSNTLKSN